MPAAAVRATGQRNARASLAVPMPLWMAQGKWGNYVRLRPSQAEGVCTRQAGSLKNEGRPHFADHALELQRHSSVSREREKVREREKGRE